MSHPASLTSSCLTCSQAQAAGSHPRRQPSQPAGEIMGARCPELGAQGALFPVSTHVTEHSLAAVWASLASPSLIVHPTHARRHTGVGRGLRTAFFLRVSQIPRQEKKPRRCLLSLPPSVRCCALKDLRAALAHSLCLPCVTSDVWCQPCPYSLAWLHDTGLSHPGRWWSPHP